MISLFEFMKFVESRIVAVGVTNRRKVISEVFFQPYIACYLSVVLSGTYEALK